VIDDESDNTEQHSGTADQAVSQGEERTGIPLLHAVRQIYREDILSHAYELARANNGAPGVDGQNFADIESAGLEKWLTGIREDLRNKTYRPQPVRRVKIPKPGGGERPLGIPCIRDRVVQTAAKLRKRPTSANAPTAVAAACETPLITPNENHIELQDGTRAAARKSFKDQSDGFIADRSVQA
jgi:hypothetical protein